MKNTDYLSPDEQERRFQDAISKWDASEGKDKEAYNEIWMRVYEACKANASRICHGIYNDRFHDRLMDSVEVVIRYIIKEGKRPNKLITYCYLPTFGQFCGSKAIREDKQQYIDDDDFHKDIAVDILGNRIEM